MAERRADRTQREVEKALRFCRFDLESGWLENESVQRPRPISNRIDTISRRGRTAFCFLVEKESLALVSIDACEATSGRLLDLSPNTSPKPARDGYLIANPATGGHYQCKQETCRTAWSGDAARTTHRTLPPRKSKILSLCPPENSSATSGNVRCAITCARATHAAQCGMQDGPPGKTSSCKKSP
jgi:hypothetical protein